jgi:hypothetical protein
VIAGLGRSDYRSKPTKVAAARRKELAMRRIIGCTEKRAKRLPPESLLNPYSALFSRVLGDSGVTTRKPAHLVDFVPV